GQEVPSTSEDEGPLAGHQGAPGTNENFAARDGQLHAALPEGRDECRGGHSGSSSPLISSQSPSSLRRCSVGSRDSGPMGLAGCSSQVCGGLSFAARSLSPATCSFLRSESGQRDNASAPRISGLFSDETPSGLSHPVSADKPTPG